MKLKQLHHTSLTVFITDDTDKKVFIQLEFILKNAKCI